MTVGINGVLKTRKISSYEILLSGGFYYAYAPDGSIVLRTASAIAALNAVVAVDANPKIIHLDPMFDADGQTLTLTYPGVTVGCDNITHIAGDTWTTPRITKILIDATAMGLKNFKFVGLNIREIEFEADGNPIDSTYLINCQIRNTETVGQRGVRLTGSSYTYFLYLIDCKFNNYCNYATAAYGSINFESAHDGNGQIFIIRPNYKPYTGDDNHRFMVWKGGRTIVTEVSGGSIVCVPASNNDDGVMFQLEANGMATDLKIHHVLFEQGNDCHLFDIDNSGADTLVLICDFSHNTVSCTGTGGETVTLINNDAADGDWVDGICNRLYGRDNILKQRFNQLPLGVTGNGDRFKVDVAFKGDPDNENYRQVVMGGTPERHWASAGEDDLDTDPQYICPIGVGAPHAARTDSQFEVTRSGYISNFVAYLEDAQPGGANGFTLVWEKNGADQALTITISNGETEDEDRVNSFEVAPGDLINIESIYVGGPNVTKLRGFEWWFTPKIE